MDGLFTGPGSERRRFLDRLILCFDPAYRRIAGRFERAMTSRNRLLADGVRDDAQLSGFERVMAEAGVAVGAARLEAVAAMAAIVEKRRARDPNSAFPWSSFRIEGSIESDLDRVSAIEAEDAYTRLLPKCANAIVRQVERSTAHIVQTLSSSTGRRRFLHATVQRANRKRCFSALSWRTPNSCERGRKAPALSCCLMKLPLTSMPIGVLRFLPKFCVLARRPG
jgi:hypothetical protein